MQVEDSVVNVTVPASVVSSIPIGVPNPTSGQPFDNITTQSHHLDNNNSASSNTSNALNSFSYDEVFPALPDSATHHQQQINNTSNTSMGQWNDKMRIGSSDITQVCHYYCKPFFCPILMTSVHILNLYVRVY